ncbi:MAG: AAA family ATPase [Bacteroidia bacterium]|nr:AAA family ATPase [Bacteroidia bacterium]
MKFINREADIKYLHNHFDSEPNSLLFLYGPKSSGKSTLLNKVVNEIDTKKYVINFLDLREMLIYDFNSFLDRFFPKTLYDKVQDIADGITFNIGFFGINLKNDEKLLSQNPFKLMGDKLRSAKEKNKQPIIILDEIQLLKNIYINGERYLIDELFNLFIRLTKVTHTAHIILSTSDSYFIEEIYNNAKLMKTTELYFIDHFDKKTVIDWLSTEMLTKKEIEDVWNYLGGSPWEINELLKKKNQRTKVIDICNYFVNDNYGKIYEFVRKMKDDYKEVFYEVIEQIINNQFCHPITIQNAKILDELLNIMVAHDFWFYKVNEQKITANSQSLLRAFERMIKERIY